ncbi:MAG TPA: ATPase [Bacteroidota bacterium]|jgi:hypothetical protein
MAQQIPHLKFRKNVDIGSIAAENDRFLKTCFLDTGQIENLEDMEDPKRIILGRTGTGKTAIINELKKKDWNIVSIDPEALSLQYLSNSTILQYLNQLGVHLDLFYKLLWKHIFTVELLKSRYQLEDEESQNKFLSSIFSYFGKNKKKRKAIEYLVEWTGSFFETTEYRVKEITQKLEDKISAEMGCDIKAITANAESTSSSSIEQKAEILKKAQSAVNSIQIVELNDLLNLMQTDIFTDVQKKYFLLIDDLDKDWVDQSVVYDLIKALLDTVTDFSHRIKNVKVVIALRENILEKILRSQGKRGPQREKYDPLYLQLFWTPEELTELIDLRVDQLLTGQYTSSEKVSHQDILPHKSKYREDGMTYILDRTFLRPRDLIHFLNICFKSSVGKTAFGWDTIKSAELEYSKSRLDSVFDEWRENYPSLDKVFGLFSNFESPFSTSDISNEALGKFIEEIFDVVKNQAQTVNWLDQMVQIFLDSGDSAFPEIKLRMINVLYVVGFLGVKERGKNSIKYSFLPEGNLVPEDLHSGMKLFIHPAFHRALNVRPTY